MIHTITDGVDIHVAIGVKYEYHSHLPWHPRFCFLNSRCQFLQYNYQQDVFSSAWISSVVVEVPRLP